MLIQKACLSNQTQLIISTCEEQNGQEQKVEQPQTKKQPILANLLLKKLKYYANINTIKLLTSKIQQRLDSFCQMDINAFNSFSIFCNSLKLSDNLNTLIINNMEFNSLLFMEFAQSLAINQSISTLSLTSCNLVSYDVSYLMKKLISNKTLKSINLFNNQALGNGAVNDIIYYLKHKQKSIEELNISHCNIEDSQLALLFHSLPQVKNLKFLRLSMNKLESDSLIQLGFGLSQLSKISKLELIDISFNCIKNSGIAILNNAISQKQIEARIKELNLAGNKLTSSDHNEMVDIDLQQLLFKLGNNLQVLDISQNAFESVSGLNLHSLKQLKSLNLSSTKLSKIPKLFQKFQSLITLNLSNNKIGIYGAIRISNFIKRNSSLKELNLNNNYIASEGYSAILISLSNSHVSNLQRLFISNNHLDGQSILTTIVNHDRIPLQQLDLSNNYIRYSLIYVLLNKITQGALKTLILGHLLDDSEAPYNQIQETANLNRFSIICENLRELSFKGNKNLFPIIISSLLANSYKKISVLDISECVPISGKDLINLGSYIKNNYYLEDLNIRGLCIGDLNFDDVRSFSNSFALNNRLKKLNLSRNRLCNKIDIILKNLQLCTSLETLDLSENHIFSYQSDSIRTLLLQSKNLIDLDISQNMITMEGLFDLNSLNNWEGRAPTNMMELSVFMSKTYNKNSILNSDNFNSLQIRPSSFKLQSLKARSALISVRDLENLSVFISQNKSLRYLDISNRISLSNKTASIVPSKLDASYCVCMQEAIISHSLLFNYMDFFTNDIHQLWQLQTISISHCIFNKLTFNFLCQTLRKKMPRLKRFSIINVFTTHSQSEDLLQSLCKQKNLVFLQFNTFQFSQKCFKLLNKILKENQITQLDLSQNTFHEDWLILLGELISKYKSLQHVGLYQISLAANQNRSNEQISQIFSQFYEYLTSSSAIRYLIFSYQNQMFNLLQKSKSRGSDILPQFGSIQNLQFKIKSTFSCASINSETSEAQLNKSEMEQNNSHHQCLQFVSVQGQNNLNIRLFNSLKTCKILHLNIQKCQLSLKDLEMILFSKQNNFLSCIKSYNFSENNIYDEGADVIFKIINNSDYLQELYLSSNQISHFGFKSITEGINSCPDMQVIDISNNNCNNQIGLLILDIVQRKIQMQKQQLFLIFIISLNKLTQEINASINQIYNLTHLIYIENDWKSLGTDLAVKILVQQITLRMYFCFNTSTQYTIPIIFKQIDFRNCLLNDNFCIIFSRIFYNFPYIETIDLRNNPSITSCGCMFMYIHLLDQRYDISHLKQLLISSDGPEDMPGIVNQGVARIFFQKMQKKFKLVNNLASNLLSSKYLQPVTYSYNYSLISYLQQRRIIFNILVLIFMFTLFYHQMLSFYPVWATKDTLYDYQYITLSLVTYLSCIEFFAVILARNFSIKLFEEKNKKRKSNWASYITYKEFFLNIYSQLTRSDILLDANIYKMCLDQKYYVLMAIIAIIIGHKLLLKMLNYFSFLYQLCKIKPKEDIAIYLTLLWKFTLIQGYWQFEQLALRVCPTYNIVFFGIQINYRSYYLLKKGILEEFPMLLIYLLYTLAFMSNDLETENRFMFTGFFKSFLVVIVSLYQGFMFVPTKITQNLFDELINTKIYHQQKQKLRQSSHFYTNIVNEEAINLKEYLLLNNQFSNNSMRQINFSFIDQPIASPELKFIQNKDIHYVKSINQLLDQLNLNDNASDIKCEKEVINNESINKFPSYQDYKFIL